MPGLTFTDLLKRGYSAERFDGYRTRLASDAEAIALLVWDALLAQAAQLALGGLEITLRNSLDRAISRKHGDAWIDDPQVLYDPRSQAAIQAARTEIEQEDRRSPAPIGATSHGRLIATLRFGFWTTLLGREYAYNPLPGPPAKPIWPDLLPSVFPFAPRPIKRGNIYLRFELVRHYRNRVAHHDAIWLGRPPGAKGGEASVLDQHAEVLEALQWMNPQVRDLLVAVDQLPGAYHGGWQGVLARLTDAKLPLP